MGHGIFPNYGKQWIKSGEFNSLTKSEKNLVFFPKAKKKSMSSPAPEEEESVNFKRKKKK